MPRLKNLELLLYFVFQQWKYNKSINHRWTLQNLSKTQSHKLKNNEKSLWVVAFMSRSSPFGVSISQFLKCAKLGNVTNNFTHILYFNPRILQHVKKFTSLNETLNDECWNSSLLVVNLLACQHISNLSLIITPTKPLWL